MISLDIETTGLSPENHGIASIGAVHMESGEEFYEECKIHNSIQVSDRALKVNGFTEEQLRRGEGKPISLIIKLFTDWAHQLSDHKELLVGWNLPSFDLQFIKKETTSGRIETLFGHRFIDLHSMAFMLTKESLRSIDACSKFGVESEPEPHNALEGAKMNVRLYNAIMSELHDHGVDNAESWMLTASGNKVHFPQPSEHSISLDDIAHGLSQTCRFAGQGNVFYSIGAHSLSVAMMVAAEGGSTRECIQALLHDSAEAYLGDVPSPAKKYLPDYQRLEKSLLSAIEKTFAPVDLVNLSSLVKWADLQHLYWEANQLFDNPDWTGEVESDYLKDKKIITMQPMQTKLAFEEYYFELLDES